MREWVGGWVGGRARAHARTHARTHAHTHTHTHVKYEHCHAALVCSVGACVSTGSDCITSCLVDDSYLPNGFYQSCESCNGFARCIDGVLHDGMPCPPGTVWDDGLNKRCEYSSSTCVCKGKYVRYTCTYESP